MASALAHGPMTANQILDMNGISHTRRNAVSNALHVLEKWGEVEKIGYTDHKGGRRECIWRLRDALRPENKEV